jgi:hypothetical protein
MPVISGVNSRFVRQLQRASAELLLRERFAAQVSAGKRTTHPSQLEVIVVPPARTEFGVHVGVLQGGEESTPVSCYPIARAGAW